LWQKCCGWCVGSFLGLFQLLKGGLKASETVHTENINPLIWSFKQKIVCGFSGLKGSKTTIIFNNFLKSLTCPFHSSQVIKDVLHVGDTDSVPCSAAQGSKPVMKNILLDNRLHNSSS